MHRIDYESFYIEMETINIQKDKVQLVSCFGRINNQNSLLISKEINRIFEDKIYNVILNLTELEYLNSIGIAIVLSIVKTVDYHQGKFVIGGMSDQIEAILKLVELPGKFKVYSSVNEAIDNWSKN
ncbi:MAG: STAS domain-containing protein [Leptospiraceae bacterium]|nr:STAS domain-containing protein [Leptospiraceae bacterium]MCP5495947.1 STAS domain-containing protein [Leptospiraceae bacterium]